MKFILNLIQTVGAVLLGVVVASLLIQVVSRYILHLSVSWTEEMARYTLVWLTFLGAATAVVTRQQITVDVITSLFPGRFQRAIPAISAIAGLVAIVFLVSASRVLFGFPGLSTTPAMGLELRWVYLAVPVSGGIFVLFLVSELVRVMRSRPVAPSDAHEPIRARTHSAKTEKPTP
jgi:TRAP-type transport system small permease protein